jgi:hypothetical protein
MSNHFYRTSFLQEKLQKFVESAETKFRTRKTCSEIGGSGMLERTASKRIRRTVQQRRKRHRRANDLHCIMIEMSDDMIQRLLVRNAWISVEDSADMRKVKEAMKRMLKATYDLAGSDKGR